MILDSLKLRNVIVQLRYADAFELWDRAGAVGREFCNIWPDLQLLEGQPQQQSLKGPGVQIQTGFNQATLTLTGSNSFDQRKQQQIKDTFEIWRKILGLEEVKRISTRAIYVKELASIKELNSELINLNMVHWPTEKVFDQPMDAELNTFEIAYKFEDANSFAFLRLKTELIKFEADLDPDFVDEPEIRKTKNRLVLDFDRGLLGSVNAEKFRMDDWIKGFQHLMRRDIGKVIKA